MKKTILACLLLAATLIGCKKDNDSESFNYNLNDLYGTWRVTEILSSGTWVDVTTWAGQQVFTPTYATFRSDGTYYGSGYFGTGSGTYKAIGNTIYTYVDGSEYLRYTILSFSGNKCHLKMGQAGSSTTIEIKCTKQ